jgi:hypothetical protein
MPNFFAKNLAAWAGSAASLGIGASGIQLFFALVHLALELNGLLHSLLGLPAGADHSPRALSAVDASRANGSQSPLRIPRATSLSII